MIKLLSKFWGWGKRHVFHFITVIIFITIGVIIAAQQTMIYSLKNKLEEVPSKISKSESNIKEWVSSEDSQIKNKVDDNYEAINARVDIVDSAIEPDQKRRMLITKIRNAIDDNTKKTMGARELNKIANAVIDYSYEFNLTIPQVLAQIHVESGFNCKATSPAGAQGCMQIMPDTLRYIQHELPNAPSRLNTWNIYHNIRAGCFYMAEQIERFGSYEEALKAYNWGPHRVAKFNAGLVPENEYPQETKEYVPKILNLINEYKKYGLEDISE